jgi:hypothetical protein
MCFAVKGQIFKPYVPSHQLQNPAALGLYTALIGSCSPTFRDSVHPETSESNYKPTLRKIPEKRLQWSRGSVLNLWYPSSRVQTRPEAVRIFQGDKNPQHAFLQRGSKSLSHVADLRHVKEP